jgi:TP901 family phage tail tape measure protein
MASAGEIKARLTLDSKSFQVGMAQARSEMSATSKAAQNTKKSLTGIQTGAAIVGTGVVAALAGATMAAANFEKQLSAIESVSGASQSEMGQLSKLIMDLGESSVYSASQVGVAAEELLKAGVSMEDILGGALKGSLDLASAGTLQLGEAAEIASTALNAFKADGLSVSKAADILSGAANASATSVGELKFGLSMVSAVASGAGMSFKDTSTALAVFANNGLKSSDAGTSLKTMLMNLSPSTKEATEVMKELGIITKDGSNQFYDAQGNLKSLAEITDVLRDSLIKLNPKERGEALKQMFGSDGIRAGTILFKEGSEGIEAMAAAMDKIKAADVARVKLDNLIGAFEEFKGALETAGIKIGNEFLPVFKEIVKGGTDVVRMFSGLDPAMVATGLKAAGAGAGMALLLSTLVKLRTAFQLLMVHMGPAGWAILGISALTAAYVGYNDSVARNSKVNLDNARSMMEQERTMSGQIERFEALRGKMSLTSDELERLVDLRTEMSQTTDAEDLEYLKSVYEDLAKRSGLTNDEIEEYVRLNGDLIETVQQSTLKITEKGNALITETDSMRKLNSEQRENIRLELEAQKAKAEANYNRNLEKEEKLKNQIVGHNENIKATEKEINEQQKLLVEEQEKLENSSAATKWYWERQVGLRKQEIQDLQDANDLEYQRLVKKDNSLDKVQQEIGKLKEVEQEMINLELSQVGLNAKKGNGLKLIDSEIAKLEAQRKKITEGTSAKDRQNAEYQETINKIDSEISGLKRARENVESITGEQSRTNSKIREGATAADILQRKLGMDVTKKVTVVGGNAEAQRLHELLSQPAYKTVYVNESNLQRGLRQNERAYRNTRHQGGTLHDLIPKFHEGGSPALSLPAAHHEVDVRLLRNEMVLTEAQQASLFRTLDAPTVSDSGSEPVFNPQELSAIKSLLGVIADNTAQGSAVYLDGKELTNAVDWLQAVQASNDFRNKGGKMT